MKRLMEGCTPYTVILVLSAHKYQHLVQHDNKDVEEYVTQEKEPEEQGIVGNKTHRPYKRSSLNESSVAASATILGSVSI